MIGPRCRQAVGKEPMAAGIDRFRRQTISLAAAGCLSLPGTGQAAAAAARIDAERGIARCIRQAAGGRPWLEMTLWGLRDQEAGWVGAEVPNSNGSHDLGPLQINSQWVVRSRLRRACRPEAFATG